MKIQKPTRTKCRLLLIVWGGSDACEVVKGDVVEFGKGDEVVHGEFLLLLLLILLNIF